MLRPYLVASSSLAMWCSMSLSFCFPPPQLLPPARTLTYLLCFPLTRWSSHLCRCFLQVLLRHAPRRSPTPARRLPVTPRGLYPAWASRGHLPGWPLRTTRVSGRRLRLWPHRHASPSRCSFTSDVPTPRVPDRQLRPHRHASPSRCVSTSDVPDWRRCLRRHRWPAYATGGVFSANDTDIVAKAPSYPCRDAGVPPFASSPTPASCSLDGDVTSG